MGFMGQSREKLDYLCRLRIEEPNLENQKIILNKMDKWCLAHIRRISVSISVSGSWVTDRQNAKIAYFKEKVVSDKQTNIQ